MGYLGATLTWVFTRARSGRVIQRCNNRNPRWETGPGSANGVTHRKREEDFRRFEKVSWVETCHRTRRVNFRGSQRPDEFARYGRHTRWGRGRWKSQNKKNVYLSPYAEEPLNSKVIKSFVPELRSRKCFSCFEIPIFYVYMLWTFYVCFTYLYHGYGTLVDLVYWLTFDKYSNMINIEN